MTNGISGIGLASLAILARNTYIKAKAELMEGQPANNYAQLGIVVESETLKSPSKAKILQNNIVDNWLSPCCICGGIEFIGATFLGAEENPVESFWCMTCQVVPDGWIKSWRVNSPENFKVEAAGGMPSSRSSVT